MLPVKKRRYSQAQIGKARPLVSTSGYINKRRRFTPPPRTTTVNRGFTRAGGFYGRYGSAARDLGIVPEKKFFDTALTFNCDTTAESASSSVTGQIDLIPQGDTESTRDGRQCTITSIELKGALTFTPGASATASGVVMMYLVLDTQANGAQATWADIYSTTSIQLSLNNMANSGRFRTLKKWTWVFNPPAGATTAYNTQTKFMQYFKNVNIPMEFSAATGALTEIKSNHVFLAYGSYGTALDDTVGFAGACRIRFRG